MDEPSHAPEHAIGRFLHCGLTRACRVMATAPDDLCDCDYIDDPYYGNVKLTDVDEALRRMGLSKITSDVSREEVIRMLGDPQEAGGGEKTPTLGYIWPWIKYHRVDCQLRFEFQKSGQLRGLSILDPDWKPGA